MPEIFGRTPLAFGGGFAADAANITFGAFTCPTGLASCATASTGFGPGAGLLAQQINFTYQQPIQRLFEIGGNYAYYVAGRPQGNASFGRILGPRPVVVSFYTTFGNVCTGPYTTLIFRASQGCSVKPFVGGTVSAGFYFGMTGCLLQSVGVSVQAQDMIVNEQLQFMFISLLIPNAAGILDENSQTFSPTLLVEPTSLPVPATLP